ncbi:hypothetical protein D3C87_2145330 [compost metagenome]
MQALVGAPRCMEDVQALARGQLVGAQLADLAAVLTHLPDGPVAVLRELGLADAVAVSH